MPVSIEKQAHIFRTVLGSKFDLFLERVKVDSSPYRKLMAYYNCAMMEVETKFRVLNEEQSLEGEKNPIEFIKTRIKSPESVYQKLCRKDLPMDIETIEREIADIAGVRVICSMPEDVYTLTECFLRQDDVHLIEMKDYVKNPKPNGYRSLHMIVEIPIFLKDEKRNMKVEVQVRTIAMDFWASLEHKLRYKKNISPEIQDELARRLTACAEQSAALDEEMQAIRKLIIEASKPEEQD